MTREDILINSIWIQGKLLIQSNFFNKEVTVNLYTSDYVLSDTKAIISSQFVAAVNDFLSLSEEDKPLAMDLLYKHCIECCQEISYGHSVLDGETETQTNLREFGIQNKEEAFKNSHLHHIMINESEVKNHRFVRMQFYPIWEDEHGCQLIIKNGKF